MSKKLYVGSLSYSIDETQLNDLFTPFGAIISAKIINDRDTGRSKGFGFVEFEDTSAADEAIDELNGKEISGRTIVVNEARPQAPRGGGFGGGRRGGRY